ncbi:MAG: lytic transglycosylase domain-containing protein [Bacteroidetes bacterium]|nr:lytic transglycosylase domain-containing protein [Bacteroidota bacterium]
MKTVVIKTICAICLSVGTSFTVMANSFNDTDTSKEIQAVPGTVCDNVIILQQANFKYPEIFAGNEAQSLEYVEKFSTARKEYLVRTYQRSRVLFPKAEAILKKYDIPEEFKVLLALESGFNANAVSSAGAVGYWQFMDEVAKEYGLKIPRKTVIQVKKKQKGKHKKSLLATIVKLKGIDERKNFNKSTIAAARYLKDRSRNLDNDWLLIAASYNCGVGNVWNAMERSGKKSPTFWDIKKYLPAETRAYVMNFITLNVIFHNYDLFSKDALYFRDITCTPEEPVVVAEDSCDYVIQ